MPSMIRAENARPGNASKRIQLFTLAAPLAARVQLAGDFTQWQDHPINLRKCEDGVWRANVELSPGAHQYRFLVDGQWRDDPHSAQHVRNPFGSEDAVCQIA
jgi:1,4-alpha-glucan branching enzyme